MWLRGSKIFLIQPVDEKFGLKKVIYKMEVVVL